MVVLSVLTEQPHRALTEHIHLFLPVSPAQFMIALTPTPTEIKGMGGEGGGCLLSPKEMDLEMKGAHKLAATAEAD